MIQIDIEFDSSRYQIFVDDGDLSVNEWSQWFDGLNDGFNTIWGKHQHIDVKTYKVEFLPTIFKFKKSSVKSFSVKEIN